MTSAEEHQRSVCIYLSVCTITASTNIFVSLKLFMILTQSHPSQSVFDSFVSLWSLTLTYLLSQSFLIRSNFLYLWYSTCDFLCLFRSLLSFFFNLFIFSLSLLDFFRDLFRSSLRSCLLEVLYYVMLSSFLRISRINSIRIVVSLYISWLYSLHARLAFSYHTIVYQSHIINSS